MRVSRQLTAQQEAVTVEDGFHLLKSVESADHLVPFPRQVHLAHSGFQFGLEQDGQEAAEHMTPDCEQGDRLEWHLDNPHNLLRQRFTTMGVWNCFK